MKKTILFCVSLLFILASCSTHNEYEENSDLTNSDLTNIKVFKSIDEFKNTLSLFNSFKSNADFENWSSNQNFNSLYNSDSFIDEDQIPFRFLFLLNENKEFIIGNKIIRFSNGFFYEYPIDESGNIGKEKKIFAKVTISKIPMKENSNEDTTSSRVDINASGGDFKEGWEEFTRVSYAVGCASPTPKSLKYRLVHYLVVQNTSGPLFIQSDLVFKLRMSQYHDGSWVYNNTSTERLYSFNVSGNWYVRSKQGGGALTNGYGTFSESDSNDCGNPLKGTKGYWLGYYNFVNGTNLDLYKWDVSLSGSVFHKVNGDVNEVDTYINW